MTSTDLPPLGIVVGYDGSAGAEAALAWAARSAAQEETALRIVLAVPPGGLGRRERRVVLRGALRSMVEEAAAEVRDAYPGLPVETAMPDAGEPPADALLRAGAAGDVMVVGSRGAGGFTGLLVGSVALKVCARSTIPVIVVPPGALPESDRVVVGVADRTDTPALDFGAVRARVTGGSVVALHAWVVPAGAFAPGVVVPPVVDTGELLVNREAALEQVIEPVRERHPGITIHARLTEDGAAAALVEASADAALVAVAAHRRRTIVPNWLGSTTHAVLHHAHCPVAVVPVRRANRAAEPGE